MDAIEIRDSDGFLIVVPKSKMESEQIVDKSKGKVSIGQDWLVKRKGICISEIRTQKQLTIKPSSDYAVNYSPKSWQYKAWETISSDIDWSAKNEFTNVVGNFKLRHIRRIGLALKIRADDQCSKSRPVLFQLAPDKCKTGMYITIDTPAELVKWMSKAHTTYGSTFAIESYITKANKLGYRNIAYIMKALIIYTDKSYDSILGNPYQLEILLGLNFNNNNDLILKHRR